MADRIVKVSLLLTATNYVRGQMEAERATNKTRDAAAQASAKLQAQKDVMQSVGRSGILMGTLVAAGIALAVKRYAEFDQAMSNVIATGEDARKNQDALRKAALDAGAATVFSATEAANAIEELAKAGVSARDILGGGLNASLDLASAGQLGVAEAAGIAATAMTQFKLRGEDMAHVADLLAAGAGKAMGDVSQLGQALGQAGLVAKGTGLSIEETTAGLSAFASAGLLGSDAGTSFKAMLQRLTPQSAEAEKLMAKLGISAYDAQGNFVGLAEFAGNLKSALADLTPEQRNSALATIFGSDAVRAANVLYSEGEEGIRDWTEAVNDQGYASEVARQRLDNLMGDVEALGGAFDTALIKTGSGANDTLRGMVQILTELISQYADLPDGVQQTVLAVGGVVAAVALAGGTALVAVPKWVAFKTAVATSGTSLKATALTAGAAGLALAGLFAILGQLAARQAEMRAGAAEFTDSLDESTGSVTAYTRELVAKKLAERGAFDGAKDAGVTQKEFTDALLEGGDAVEKLRHKFYDFANANPFSLTIANAGNALNDLDTQLRDAEVDHKDLKAATDEASASTDVNAESTKSAAGAYLEAADGAEALNNELNQLIDQINEANGVGQDAVSANIAYRDALAKVDETIKSGEGTRDDHLGLLVDLAKKSQDAAGKQLELDGNTDTYIATLAAGRQTLLDRARDLGLNAEEAGALADQIFRIPSKKEVAIIAETARAQSDVNSFITTNSGKQIPIRIVADGSAFKLPSGTVVSSGYASGGGIYGSGPKGVDSVPILAAPGEHVLTDTEVDLMGGQNAVYAFRAALRAGRLPRYANGGAIQPRYATDTFRGGASTRITIAPVVHAAPGMDVDALASKVVRKIEGKLK